MRWLKLLKVELYKLVTRKITWVLLALLIFVPILTVGMEYMVKNVINNAAANLKTMPAPTDEDGKELEGFNVTVDTPTDPAREDKDAPPPVTLDVLKEQLEDAKHNYDSSKFDLNGNISDSFDEHSTYIVEKKNRIDALEKYIELGEYKKPKDNNQWMALYGNTPYNNLMIILSVIIGLSIAGEFASGTMKQMFSRPYGRTQILTTKYVSTLLYGAVAIMIHFVVYLLARGIVYGFDLENVTRVFVWDGNAIAIGFAQHAFLVHFLTWLSMALLTAFSMMIAVWTRSSAATIGLTVALGMIAAPLFVQISQYLHWFSFFPFAYMDLRPTVQQGTNAVWSNTFEFSMFGGLNVKDLSYGVSSTLTLVGWFVYTALFTTLSIIGFRKRDL